VERNTIVGLTVWRVYWLYLQVFGEALCRVIFAVFAIPMYVSTLMILFIAVDRYRRVVCHRPLSSFAAKALVVGSVVASSALGVPVVAFSSLHQLDDADLGIRRRYCVEDWPSETLRCGYALLTFAGQFGVPLAVSAALYWLIYRRLKRRRPPPGHINSNRRFVTTYLKGAITSKIKHAINIKQVLQDLHNCCTTVAALILISILF